MANFLSFPILEASVKDWANHYQHTWQNGTPDHVLVGGENVRLDSERWAELSKRIFKDNKVSSGWRYDKDGFTEHSYIKWTKLKPTHQRMAAGKHYVEVVTAQDGVFGLGRHAFMRLEDKEGQVTSVGFVGAVKFPFCWKRGAIISPDIREVTAAGHRTTRVELTEEQYGKLKGRIERDKNEKREVFHPFERNCAAYVSQVLREELGLDIDNKEYPTQALFRKFLYFIKAKKAHPNVLGTLHKVAAVFRFVISPFYALVWIAVGSPFIQKDAREMYKSTMADRPVRTMQEKFMSFIQVDYMRISTGWRISVWQDMAAKMGNTITLDQARSIQLERHTEMAHREGAALNRNKNKMGDFYKMLHRSELGKSQRQRELGL